VNKSTYNVVGAANSVVTCGAQFLLFNIRFCGCKIYHSSVQLILF
jgi:hypothetical protein